HQAHVLAGGDALADVDERVHRLLAYDEGARDAVQPNHRRWPKRRDCFVAAFLARTIKESLRAKRSNLGGASPRFTASPAPRPPVRRVRRPRGRGTGPPPHPRVARRAPR